MLTVSTIILLTEECIESKILNVFNTILLLRQIQFNDFCLLGRLGRAGAGWGGGGVKMINDLKMALNGLGQAVGKVGWVRHGCGGVVLVTSTIWAELGRAGIGAK